MVLLCSWRVHFQLFGSTSHCCRDNAFRLKPLQMSEQLIQQLNAIEVKLQEAASKLQDLVNQNKNKAKHYAATIDEAHNIP